MGTSGAGEWRAVGECECQSDGCYLHISLPTHSHIDIYLNV